jgi:hypothetical protein
MLAEQHFRILAPQGEILERAKGIEQKSIPLL